MDNQNDDKRPKGVFEMIAGIRSGEINPAEMYKGTPAENVVNDGAIPLQTKKIIRAMRAN